ncbi:chymotrypsin inhibitor Ani s 6-like [Leptopilina heterotoma]|uniref:chymotrypsin inhibitor Ani s 6-like n=1 Tax=Leptopilina heterotoma TaxID=63436 RepID=UPI001CAA1AF3|nr:chymotrypsin inhibitor Ani s 6-like [Leptopilina heterotoma]
MSRFVTTFFIVLVVFAVTIDVEAGGRCSPDEVWSECGRQLSCQRTCYRRQVCSTECEPACMCRSGTVRSSDFNRTCVLIQNCPQ